ncbi:MAG TPA: Holliday junction resolvase RuvX, partial [Gemmatimonadales bacterium]|nr:Holliday junction resolvase RuvX [Gemmatimonadales bacterium]
RRSGKRFPMRELLTLVEQHAVTGVVVGLPLDQEGAEAEAATAARALAADIAQHSGKPVELWDERLTTARALRAVRAMGGSTKGRKDDVDALAAAVLLQHYLDAKRGSAT